jgi:hypothetical protein
MEGEMKRAIAVILILVSLLAGCDGPSSTQSPTPTPTKKPTPNVEVDLFEWRWKRLWDKDLGVVCYSSIGNDSGVVCFKISDLQGK